MALYFDLYLTAFSTQLLSILIIPDPICVFSNPRPQGTKRFPGLDLYWTCIHPTKWARVWFSVTFGGIPIKHLKESLRIKILLQPARKWLVSNRTTWPPPLLLLRAPLPSSLWSVSPPLCSPQPGCVTRNSCAVRTVACARTTSAASVPPATRGSCVRSTAARQSWGPAAMEGRASTRTRLLPPRPRG